MQKVYVSPLDEENSHRGIAMHKCKKLDEANCLTVSDIDAISEIIIDCADNQS